VQNSAANLFRSRRFFTQPLSCSSPIRFGQHVKIVQLTIGDEEKVQLALEHADIQVRQCPLLGVKRTSQFQGVMSAYDPKRTLAFPHGLMELGLDSWRWTLF
jgi:hypothetical protein